MTSYREQGVVFSSGHNRLVGIAAVPQAPAEVGVLILVGGPQYRVGSHRQFTLLARSLAESGIASFRFDFSGMGDSEGDDFDFRCVDQDVGCAIETFCKTVPEVKRVVLWGLCDGASAAMIIANSYDRISGLILLNPWVHSGDYAPQVKMQHYYRQILTGREYWKRLLTGKVNFLPPITAFGKLMFSWFGAGGEGDESRGKQLFVQDMQKGLESFGHPVLVILSGEDLTADEFSNLLHSSRSWRSLASRPSFKVHTIGEADHTFSRKSWSQDVTRLTRDWVQEM